MTEILSPISTDFPNVPFSLSNKNGSVKGKEFWRFNSSLTRDQKYIIDL